MFEAARLLVHLVPRHAQHVVQEHFGQAVAPEDADRDREPILGQRGVAACRVGEVAVRSQFLEHAGDRSGRDAEIGGEAGRGDARAFAL